MWMSCFSGKTLCKGGIKTMTSTMCAFAILGCSSSFILKNHKMRFFSEMSSIADLRKEYSKHVLLESESPANPFDLFKLWFDEACVSKVLEPNAMCLATCKDNKPSARIVLLKGYDHRGFVWYTNYNSRKSQDIQANPYAALTFWWGDLERSVRIEGTIECVTTEESEEYFSSRPRTSQIGAWTSHQSEVIASREDLEKQEAEMKLKFEGMATIPKPEHWGGFRLTPHRIEFWKGRESRLHDRLEYTRSSSSCSADDGTTTSSSSSEQQWVLKRLQP